MKVKILNKQFIRTNHIVTDFIRECEDNKLADALIKGLTNVSRINDEVDEFEYVTSFYQQEDKWEIIVQNNLGAFIIREDNFEAIQPELTTLEKHDIKRIIKAKDKTILLDVYGNKYYTNRQPGDKYDLEKAVMMLLLKHEGYKVKDIYEIIDSVK